MGTLRLSLSPPGMMGRRVALQLLLLAALALGVLGQSNDDVESNVTAAKTQEEEDLEKDAKHPVPTAEHIDPPSPGDSADNLNGAFARRNKVLQDKYHKPVQKAFVSSMPGVISKKAQAEKQAKAAKKAENGSQPGDGTGAKNKADQADCYHSENLQEPCPAKPCGDHGFLVDFVCYCQNGWQGANCTIPVCPQNCNHAGYCNNGSCICNERVTGMYCQHCQAGYNASSFPKCTKDVASCPGNCSGHGQCELDGSCTCEPPFNGTDCGYIACPNDCSGHGECETEIGRPRGVKRGECVCNDGWSNDDCGVGTCPSMCSGHGLCHRESGECSCKPGWAGKNCAIRLCPNNCGGPLQGACLPSGQCKCKGTWGGTDCSIRDAICAFNCSLHGLCNKGKCQCFDGYEGEFCSLKRCPNDCNCGANVTTGTSAAQNFTDCQGLCDKNTGVCHCLSGYSGVDCSKPGSNEAGSFGCHKQCKIQCEQEAEAAKKSVLGSQRSGSQRESEDCIEECEGKCVASQIKPAVPLESNKNVEPDPEGRISKTLAQ